MLKTKSRKLYDTISVCIKLGTSETQSGEEIKQKIAIEDLIVLKLSLENSIAQKAFLTEIGVWFSENLTELAKAKREYDVFTHATRTKQTTNEVGNYWQ